MAEKNTQKVEIIKVKSSIKSKESTMSNNNNHHRGDSLDDNVMKISRALSSMNKKLLKLRISPINHLSVGLYLQQYFWEAVFHCVA